jgi:3-carboxy-cis,cis-muconate cycloisomerase
MARGGVAAAVDDAAWLRAMLDIEAALARGCARVGLVPAEAAAAITEACADPALIDVEALGAGAARTGNPVVELLSQLRARLPAGSAEHLHHGATSQDVMDTASVLLAVRALTLLDADLHGCAAIAAGLARRHRDSVLTGRTLMQAAVPTTFGLVAAGWLSGLDGARQRSAAVRRALPAELGGPVGGSVPVALLEAFADELGLAAPALAWHTIRLPIADLAGLLASVCGVVAKIALDVVLLGQSEVAEVREQAPGRGASSTMAHKANPVAAIAARACAARAPGLAATLFASMEQEHQRAAGRWPAEWVTLSDLLRCTGSAVAWLQDGLQHLVIDADRMRANAEAANSAAGLKPIPELGPAPSFAEAGAYIDRTLAAAAHWVGSAGPTDTTNPTGSTS